MEKNRTVQRRKAKKKNRPKLRFKVGTLLSIFILSFVACFVLYMTSANLNSSFLEDEFGISTSDMADDGASQQAINTSGVPNTPDTAESAQSGGAVNPVPQSAAADVSYFDNCCLITDTTLLGLKDNGGFGGGSIFGSAEIDTSTVMTVKLESSFGTLSAYDIVKQKKPETLYIMLGSELGTATADSMAANYSTLVSSLQSALPDMKIYVMQYPPALYDSDTLTNEMINDYNNKLLMMCNNLGVYCIDTNIALKSEDGRLSEEYWSYETLSFSKAGLDKITDYILTHIA